MAGNRTRVNCLEGSYAHHYTTNAAQPGRHPRDATPGTATGRPASGQPSRVVPRARPAPNPLSPPHDGRDLIANKANRDPSAGLRPSHAHAYACPRALRGLMALAIRPQQASAPGYARPGHAPTATGKPRDRASWAAELAHGWLGRGPSSRPPGREATELWAGRRERGGEGRGGEEGGAHIPLKNTPSWLMVSH